MRPSFKQRGPRRSFIAGVALLTLSCGESLIDEGELVLRPVAGSERWAEGFGELDRVTVHTVTRDGERALFREWDAPIGSFTLGRGEISRFELSGPGIRGSSVWLNPAGLAGHRVPLLVGPAHEFGLAATLQGEAPEHAAVVAERYLLTLSGAEGRLYDLALLDQSPPFDLPCPGSSCQIENVVMVGGWIGVFIGPDGASYLDFDTGARGSVTAPEGGSFGDVSGGRLVRGANDDQWLVGATRSAASPRVLHIAKDGKLSFLHLSAPRKGAQVSFLASHGLLIYGGSSEAAGGELLEPGAASFRPLLLEPDPTEGATLLRLDYTKLLRVGGQLAGAPAPTRLITLGCASVCPLEPYDHELTLEVLQLLDDEGDTLARVKTSPDGQDPPGEQVIELDLSHAPPTWRAVPGLERRGTQLLKLPTGQVARLGGDEQLELYF